METITIELLIGKLKNAPQSVLERVIGYVDALIEPAAATANNLSKEQQQILDSQIHSDISTYTDAESLYNKLKNKYEL